MRSTPLPTGPASLAQSQHLRRESSQSQHGDPMHRNFVPSNGRGRGYNPQYPGPNLQHSPQAFRSSPVPQPRNLSNVQSFQPGRMGGMPNNAYANRSPAQAPVSMHQPHMNGQHMPQYGGPHSQYLQVNNPVSFRDASSTFVQPLSPVTQILSPIESLPPVQLSVAASIAKGASTSLGRKGFKVSRFRFYYFIYCQRRCPASISSCFSCACCRCSCETWWV